MQGHFLHLQHFLGQRLAAEDMFMDAPRKIGIAFRNGKAISKTVSVDDCPILLAIFCAEGPM